MPCCFLKAAALTTLTPPPQPPTGLDWQGISSHSLLSTLVGLAASTPMPPAAHPPPPPPPPNLPPPDAQNHIQQLITELAAASAAASQPITLLSLNPPASSTHPPQSVAQSAPLFALPATTGANSALSADQLITALQTLRMPPGPIVVPRTVTAPPPQPPQHLPLTVNTIPANKTDLLSQLCKVKKLETPASSPASAVAVVKTEDSLESPKPPAVAKATAAGGKSVHSSGCSTAAASPAANSYTPASNSRSARNSDGSLDPCLVCGDVASGKPAGLGFFHCFLLL